VPVQSGIIDEDKAVGVNNDNTEKKGKVGSNQQIVKTVTRELA
jgi:hypothetical protein